MTVVCAKHINVLNGSSNINHSMIKFGYDFKGNLFAIYDNKYYYVMIDDESGLCFEKINHIEKFINVDDYNKKIGQIQSGNTTLRGKVLENLNNKDEEEIQDMDMYDYNNYYPEKSLFYLQNNEEENSDCESIDDESFNINGEYLDKSILSFETIGSFDVVVIEGSLTSKFVVFTMERSNGICCKRLTIFTDGIFKVNYIGTIEKYYDLVIDFDNGLGSDNIPRFLLR